MHGSRTSRENKIPLQSLLSLLRKSSKYAKKLSYIPFLSVSRSLTREAHTYR